MIYFDNAATTDLTGNPASPHMRGIEASRFLSASSESLATLVNCRPDEIVFTSGGTESNNLAIIGTLRPFIKRGGKILTTPHEHPSVSEAIKHIKTSGDFNVTEAPFDEWDNHLSEDLIFASCSQVNNETGDIYDVASRASEIKKINPKTVFHVDGAQGFCKEEINLSNIDLYSFSAHKFHGPVGVGGLIVKRGTKLAPLLFGGGQQNSLRPGTVNVPGILLTVQAAEQMYINMKEHRHLVSQIYETFSHFHVKTQCINRGSGLFSPYILNMSFPGLKGETLVHMLSENGVYASMGAACRTNKKGVSPLEKMGYSKERAESAVRFSFSHLNTVEEAESAGKILIECVKKATSSLLNRNS